MANKVYITNRQDAIKIPSGTRLLIRRCCNAVLVHEQITEGSEISVSFVSNEEIKKLNAEYRNKPVETDVLSFSYADADGKFQKSVETGLLMIGDVVLSIEKAMEQANMFGHSLQREVAYLVVHSVFHLLGYDHEAGGLDQVRMREREELVLKQLGLPRGSSYVFEDEE